MEKELLDLSESTLILQGDQKKQDQWKKLIAERDENLQPDLSERIPIYQKRRDFYTGNQGAYSNITGIVKDTKQKKGHTNQVTNYAGKTVVKMAFGMANNPPNFTVNPANQLDKIEVVRAQGVEDYIDSVLQSKKNQFFKKTYRRAVFVQGEYGDVAIKTYIEDGEIKICLHENMESIKIGWNGNPGEFDCIIIENYLTPSLIYDQYKIKVNEKALGKITSGDKSKATGSWNDNQWATKSTEKSGETALPSGKNRLPKLKVVEYDSKNVYAILIQDELVQLIFKDDEETPKIEYWTIIGNIPNSPSPWSIADIDYLMDAQVELNENDNRSSDHLRVGNVQRYVAYNMNDFDPESIKSSSGQVIFVDSPNGDAKFEPLATNINNFPDDQYNTRKLSQIFDMGLPKVNYGASGADSGRSKAIDYQSSVDLTQFKRDSWELGLQDIFEKIQILGNYLHGDKLDIFSNDEGQFVTRTIDFDWNDALPISQSDKIVNVANKFSMIGLSLKQAYKELGYRNPQNMIDELKEELADPNLMILRAKAWDLSQGLLMANNAAAAMNMGQNAPAQGGNQASPTLSSDQNSGNASPMAAKGGTTSTSSAKGQIDKARQNIAAKG